MLTLSKMSKRGVHINDLDDDCFLHIFSYLNEPQLIGIERVCRRWRGLCFGIWSRKKDFVFRWETWQPVASTMFTTIHLWKVLKKFGSYITNLDLHCINFEYSNLPEQQTVTIIGVLCENLKHLDLSNINSQKVDMKFKTFDVEMAQNLVTLQLDGCNLNDDELTEFLKNACNLIELSLESNLINGKCLVYVTSKLKCLNINKCKILRRDLLNEAITKFQNLEVLRANRTCIDYKIIQLLPKHLTELSIHRVSKKCYLDGEEPLLFPSLKILYIGGNRWFTDARLSKLSNICPNLEQLDVEGSSYLTQFQHLLKFKKLKILRLDNCNIDNESFNSLISSNGRFNVIGCRNCDLTDEKANRIVALSPELSCIDIGNNFEISEEFLLLAFESVCLRTTGIPLTIHGYNVENVDHNQFSHPLLKITQKTCQCQNRYASKCTVEDESDESDAEVEDDEEEESEEEDE